MITGCSELIGYFSYFIDIPSILSSSLLRQPVGDLFRDPLRWNYLLQRRIHFTVIRQDVSRKLLL